ncbi:MAG: S41 family peptidase [Bacteroidota bacterium]
MQPKLPILLNSIVCLMFGVNQIMAQGSEGYYQYPDIHQNIIVFTAEGDLWKVPIEGGVAQRFTTHTEEEKYPAISPDGKIIAYSATYEGPMEVYTMPIDGGIPERWTYSENSRTVNWTPDGKIIYQTAEFSKLPNAQLVTINLKSKEKSIVPLFQANKGTQNKEGTWFFVPLPDFNENIKRYQGGTAQQIWKFDGKNEAVKLTTDHLGESFNPMWYEGRIYFITDRDGMQNIWSMNADGKDLKQHTQHTEFDVRYANLDDGKIVYQHAADLWLLDIASGENNKINIRLSSDFEQLRETWIENPTDYITSVHPDPTGKKVVVTARGRVFVVPTKTGRTIEFTEQNNEAVIRHRDAIFSHDGKNIISLSDQSGEFEFVQFAADGSGVVKTLTKNSKLLQYQGIPSFNGKWIAYDDAENNMYVLNRSTGVSTKISTNEQGIRDFAWSPDNQWLAFVQKVLNGMSQIKVYNVNDNSIFDLTNDRSNNFGVKWSPDGKFIYYISDRGLYTLIGKPRGTRLGGVHWDKTEKVYHVPLKKSYRSPFREKDELTGETSEDKSSEDALVVTIDKTDIQSRSISVPIPSGNYTQLGINNKAIYLLAQESWRSPSNLKVASITNEKVRLTDLADGVSSFELTPNRNKLLIRKGKSHYLIDAGTGSANLGKEIDFSGCKFSINPREDWKQLFKDAWRMERDYFYDKNMHGVDWDAMYSKYLPLVDRVTTRNELNDVLAQLVGELSVLHADAHGGDMPSDQKHISVPSLGANTSRDEVNGGFKIDYIFKSDPDFSGGRSPLDDPYLDIKEGDIITKVDGKEALSAIDIGELLRNKARKQVRLTIKRGNSIRDVIAKPNGNSYWLRYGDWEYSNRLKVEKESDNQIGYLHLSAMSDWDIGQFYRHFFPVANRKGLIIDMRHNAGGWIDPIILEKLMRKSWMYRVDRMGEPYGKMNEAFNGHLIVLVNERTGSDGEVLAEGVRRLGLGTSLGMRTWGGFIALNSRNSLTDKGIMTAPMHGGYSLEGEWLVEGHGHVPDIELDNLPHETFNGKDAQLDAAIKLLLDKIEKDPRDVPPVPSYPDKSFKNNRKNK